MLNKLWKIRKSFDFNYLKKSSIKSYIYAAYLSYRYVDDFRVFPAIQFTNGIFPIRIVKSKGAKLNINNRLIFEDWVNKKTRTNITLQRNAVMIAEDTVVLGNNISILVSENAKLEFGGRKNQSASGITADSHILVKKYVRIGVDNIIAWDTFITDCDWHRIGDKHPQKDTILKENIWIGVGVKILKGAEIGANCIITANSVVINGVYMEKSLISGNPAIVVKTDFDSWCRDMNI